MAVSNSKRKKDNRAKYKARKAKIRNKNNNKKVEDMSKIISEGNALFDTTVAEINKVYKVMDALKAEFDNAEYPRSMSTEEVEKNTAEVNNIFGLIAEGKANVEQELANKNEVMEKFAKGEMEGIDVNMALIDGFMKLQEHAVYIAENKLDILQEQLKLKGIDDSKLNIPGVTNV